MSGIWEGVITTLGPEGTLVGQEQSRMHMEFPERGSIVYRETTHYTGSLGQTRSESKQATFEEGALSWDGGRAETRFANPHMHLIKIISTDDPDSIALEMMQVDRDATARVRTVHFFLAGQLTAVKTIQEWRVKTRNDVVTEEDRCL